jgi:hypothetical protein
MLTHLKHKLDTLENNAQDTNILSMLNGLVTEFQQKVDILEDKRTAHDTHILSMLNELVTEFQHRMETLEHKLIEQQTNITSMLSTFLNKLEQGNTKNSNNKRCSKCSNFLSVVCKGTTKKHKPCKCTTKNIEGYCIKHLMQSGQDTTEDPARGIKATEIRNAKFINLKINRRLDWIACMPVRSIAIPYEEKYGNVKSNTNSLILSFTDIDVIPDDLCSEVYGMYVNNEFVRQVRLLEFKKYIQACKQPTPKVKVSSRSVNFITHRLSPFKQVSIKRYRSYAFHLPGKYESDEFSHIVEIKDIDQLDPNETFDVYVMFSHVSTIKIKEIVSIDSFIHDCVRLLENAYKCPFGKPLRDPIVLFNNDAVKDTLVRNTASLVPAYRPAIYNKTINNEVPDTQVLQHIASVQATKEQLPTSELAKPAATQENKVTTVHIDELSVKRVDTKKIARPAASQENRRRSIDDDQLSVNKIDTTKIARPAASQENRRPVYKFGGLKSFKDNAKKEVHVVASQDTRKASHKDNKMYDIDRLQYAKFVSVELSSNTFKDIRDDCIKQAPVKSIMLPSCVSPSDIRIVTFKNIDNLEREDIHKIYDIYINDKKEFSAKLSDYEDVINKINNEISHVQPAKQESRIPVHKVGRFKEKARQEMPKNNQDAQSVKDRQEVPKNNQDAQSVKYKRHEMPINNQWIKDAKYVSVEPEAKPDKINNQWIKDAKFVSVELSSNTFKDIRDDCIKQAPVKSIMLPSCVSPSDIRIVTFKNIDNLEREDIRKMYDIYINDKKEFSAKLSDYEDVINVLDKEY